MLMVHALYIRETLLMEDIMAKRNLYIEISIAKRYDDDFEHWGYYDNIDEAIEALLNMKKNCSRFL